MTAKELNDLLDKFKTSEEQDAIINKEVITKVFNDLMLDATNMDTITASNEALKSENDLLRERNMSLLTQLGGFDEDEAEEEEEEEKVDIDNLFDEKGNLF